MRNPNLKTIPSCIVDMPNLEFLNVRGSDNLELPQELASKSDEYEVMPGMWNLKEL
jgi:Leucine-rich repeat (LRR) protein